MINENEVVIDILSTKNYSMLARDIVARIVKEESKKYKKQKDVVKSVKNKLHTNIDLFFDNQRIKNLSQLDLKNDQTIIELLKAHKSTNERLEINQIMYFDIFKKLKKVNSIMDLGCGLNPLYIPFVKELQNKKYLALDVNENTTYLLNTFFKVRNINGKALTCDLLTKVPCDPYDCAFMFKLVPLLVSQNKNCLTDFLNALNVKYVVITFPTKTVSGKDVNMHENYTTKFINFCNEQHKKIIFNKNYTNEVVFIIENL